MRSADQSLGNGLAAGERSYQHVTQLGGTDLSPQIHSWKVERAYNTDLPAAMRAFTGSSSAQLEVELGGTPGWPAPVLYSPWAPRSSGDLVKPGQSVVQTTGLTMSGQVPVFRGTVRSRSADSGTDTVQITALDGAERLRGPAMLPRPYAGFQPVVPPGQVQPPPKQIASATWCVDELLRQGSIFTCPPPRDPSHLDQNGNPVFGNTLLHASLHGGFAAAYGMPDSVPDPSQYSWSRAAAPYEMAVVPAQAGLTMSWMPRSRMVTPSGGILIEATVNTLVAAPGGKKVYLKAVLNRLGTTNGPAYGSVQLSVDFSAGTVSAWSGVYGSSTGGQSASWSFPTLTTLTGVWHLAAVIVTGTQDPTTMQWSSTAPVVVPMLKGPDGTILTGTGAQLSGTGGPQPDSELYRVEVVTDFATECVQATQGVTAQFPTTSFEPSWTKGATLDEVTLPLYNIPEVSGSQWDVISSIAKAALGTAEFDENGVFRWHNHTRFLTAPTVAQRTLTTVQDIASITVSEEIDACRNYCVQPYQDWSQVGYDTGTYYQDTQARMIASGGTLSIPFTVDAKPFDANPPLVDDDVVPVSSLPVAFQPPLRFASSTQPVSTGQPGAQSVVKGKVEAQLSRAGGTLTLNLKNWSANPVWTTRTDGSSSVRIVTPKPASDPVERQVVAQAWQSQNKYGLQVYTADSNEWVQDYSAAVSLASALNTAGAYPIPLFGNVEVLFDPRLQLGDAIRLQDTSGATLDTLAWVVGISTEAANDGTVKQTLTLRGTQYNGGADPTNLPIPDSAIGPTAWNSKTYAQIRTGFTTYGDITTAGSHYRDFTSRT